MSQTRKTKLSTKGQVALPKSPTVARTWESIIGCVHYAGPRKSIKEMDKAVAAEARSHI